MNSAITVDFLYYIILCIKKAEINKKGQIDL